MSAKVYGGMGAPAFGRTLIAIPDNKNRETSSCFDLDLYAANFENDCETELDPLSANVSESFKKGT